MKLLTDSQTSALFVDALRKLGWEIETVYQHGLEREKDDARLVAWARTFDFVFLTFDNLRGEQGARVAREIRERRGKVISIWGGPNQSIERALGRLLFHYPDWFPFLERYDGRVDITDLRNLCKMLPRSKLRGSFRQTGERQFEDYIEKRTRPRATEARPRRRRRPTPREQSHMDIGAAS